MFELLMVPVFTGLLLAIISGPVGCFVVWRRMSQFGDALAHSALLGVAIGISASININVTIGLVCLTIALLLAGVKQNSDISNDTWLGVLSHGGLALSLVCISLADNNQIDLYGYLFGDLLAANWQDFQLMLVCSLLIGIFLWRNWSSLVSMCLNEDLAKVEGIPVASLRVGLMLSIALLTAMAMKLVGALLITALLIIPAAAARAFAKTPSHMAALASAIAISSLIFGMIASYFWDLATGPAIVTASCIIFAFSRRRIST